MDLKEHEMILATLRHVVNENGGQSEVERRLGKKPGSGYLSRLLGGERILGLPSLLKILKVVNVHFPDFVERAYRRDPLAGLAIGKDPDPDLTALLRRFASEARAVDLAAIDMDSDEAGTRRLLDAAERLDNERYNDPRGAATQTRPLIDQVAELTVNPLRQATIAGKIAGILGSCYRTGAQLHEAEWVLQEAFRLLKSIDAQFLMGDLLLRIGVVFQDRLNYSAALQVIGEAEHIYAQLGNARYAARCWVHYGTTFCLDEQMDAATEAFETALRMLPTDELRYRFSALSGMVVICYRRGDLERSERYLLEAEKCDQSTYARALRMKIRGDLTKAKGNLPAAAKCYSAARDQLLTINPVDAALAGIDAAAVLLDLGQIAEAIATARELTRIVEPLGQIDEVAAAAVDELLLTIMRGEQITRRLLTSIRRVIVRSGATLS